MSDSKKIKICWLNGGYYYCKDILSQIKSLLNNPEIFVYDKDSQPSYIENQILGSGFFEENRLVILHDMPKFGSSSVKSNQKWVDTFDNIPEDCIVVIHDVDPKKFKELYSYISKIGKVFYSKNLLDRNESVSWVVDFFKEKQKSINDDASQLIVDFIGEDSNGFDVDKLYVACKKIYHYIGSRKKNITQEEVFASCDKYSTFIIWDILNSFEDRNFEECITLTQKACQKEKRAVDAISQILNMILWKLKMILFIKESMSNGNSQEHSIKLIKNLHKFSKSGAGVDSTIEVEMNKGGGMKECYSEMAVHNLFRGYKNRKPSIECFGRSELFKLIIAINECIRNIRHESNDSNCMMMMENFFLESCNILDSSKLIGIRRIPHGGVYSF